MKAEPNRADAFVFLSQSSDSPMTIRQESGIGVVHVPRRSSHRAGR
ncbi:hypothetical protein ACVW1C_006437 [Bradyrhizobium sp. USDA 4011]